MSALLDLFDMDNLREKYHDNRKAILIGAAIAGAAIAVIVIGIIGIVIVRRSNGNGGNKKPVVDESRHLQNLRQITNGGTNAEAYWSSDSKRLIFQGIRGNDSVCDQMYVMNVDGSDVKFVSDGRGRTTCGFFINDTHILYGSTMDTMGKGCPPNPDASFGYVWPVYKTMDIYVAEWRTGKVVAQLTNGPNYNSEATISPDGKKIVFTSARDGDLELYSMDIDGSNVKRLTYSPGYDGGAFYSHSGKQIIWRSNRPRGQNLTNYLNLLELGLVEPVATDMDLYVMDADGQNQRKIASIGGANFSPFFTPDDSSVIFASNMNQGFDFHLYTIGLDGKNLKQITSKGTFNSFPMFSRDGKYLAFESNRGVKSRHGMNVFVADWKP